jgi:chromosome segregation ATPase
VARLTARLAGEEARADEAVARMHTTDGSVRRVRATADEAAKAYAEAIADLTQMRDELQCQLDRTAEENDELYREASVLRVQIEKFNRRMRDQDDCLAASEEDKATLAKQAAQIRKLESDREYVATSTSWLPALLFLLLFCVGRSGGGPPCSHVRVATTTTHSLACTPPPPLDICSYLTETETTLVEQRSAAEAELETVLREMKRMANDMNELRNQNRVLAHEACVTRSVAEETETNVRFI